MAHNNNNTPKKNSQKTSSIGNDASEIELLFIYFFCSCLEMSLFDIGIILQNAELK